MADKDLNLKSFKPTLKPASDLGLKIDKGFNNKMTTAGVNFKTIKEEEGKDDSGKSLKKKIFSLPKMETLVAQDNYLHGIYEKMKVDASETYGYHWNETVHNILFNDYVLNDNAYLQKYKNTQTIYKKRRGEEGAQELEKAVQDKIDTTKDDGGKPEFNRKKISDINPEDSIKDKAKDQLDMEKEPTNEVADQMKNLTANLAMDEQQMDELFGLGQPKAAIITHKPSQYDSYYVDKRNNTMVGVAYSKNVPQDQLGAAQAQFGDRSKYDVVQWPQAVERHVKGIPTEVTDATPQNVAQQTAASQQKYAGIAPVPGVQENMGNADECNCPPDGKPVRNPNDAMASFSKLGENMDNVGETTSAASAGQFAGPLDGTKNTGEIADHTYKNIDETTTSASSGQFSGPAIWAKSEKNSRWAHTPAWHGGEILKESKDYLTNPETFKKYVKLVESIDSVSKILNECSLEESGLSVRQWAENILSQLNRQMEENPDLANMPEFQELIQKYEGHRDQPQQTTARPQVQPKPEPTSQWKQQPAPMKEHHLHSKQDKIDFILQHTYDDATDSATHSAEELNAMDDSQIEQLYLNTEKSIGMNEGKKKQKAMNEDPSFKGMLYKDLKDTGNKVSNKEDDNQLEKQDGLFKDKWNTNESINEDPVNLAAVAAGIAGVIGSGVGVAGLMQMLKTKYPNAYNALSNIGAGAKGSVDKFHGVQEKAESKAQQRFMGMVHADQQGKLKNPSAAVDKAAHSMSDKAAKDFASTKLSGLPDHVKEDNAAPAVGTVDVTAGSQQGNPVMIEMGKLLYPFDAGLPDAEFASKAQQFIDNDTRTKGKNPQVILDAIRKKVKELGLGEGKFSSSPPAEGQEENSFQYFVETFHNGQFSQLKQMLQQIKAEGQLRELRLYLDEMGQGEVKDWAFDNLNEESMLDDKPDSMARTMDSDELNTSGKPMGGGGSPVAESGEEAAVADFVDGPESNQGDRQDKEAIADASKFREFLKSKYGVESVAELSPRQKQEVWKEMQASKQQSEPAPEKSGMDFKNFAATDAQRAEYKGRDNKQLGFLAQHNNEVNSIQDYQALEKQYGQEMGERMFHPMAILAAIEGLPEEERLQYSNIEKVLKSQMNENWHEKDVVNPKEKGKHTNVSVADLHKQLTRAKKNKDTSLEKELNFAIRAKTGWGKVSEDTNKTEKNMNEERKTPSMLNLDKVKKETAALTQKDMANADALKQSKVYPNPDEFYIEQDKDKIQDFQTGEELEAEALKKLADRKKALENVGDSTNENGREIVKRNLTKEEKLRLAMDRGDGMHNIVYDNKPSDKFEKRLEKDMGSDQYKLRQEKMKYQEDKPSYNKDTQPVETGEKKFQDDKFKKGYNEAFTGKYTDGYGKSKLVEFMLENTEEVATVTDGYKLTLEGLGNKYTQKVNESEIFADVVNQYDFYLVENNVVRVKHAEATVITEGTLDKMKHLMGYDSRDFVNTKHSVKF